jgi:hypothetical protein
LDSYCMYGKGSRALIWTLGNLQDYLRDRHAQLYSTMRYTSLDSSAALVKSQQQRLQAHSHQFQAFAGDARDASTWQHCPPVSDMHACICVHQF